MQSWEIINSYIENLLKSMKERYSVKDEDVYSMNLRLFIGSIMIKLEIYHPEAFERIKEYIKEEQRKL